MVVLCYLIAGIQFWLDKKSHLSLVWVPQFYVLICGSILCAILSYMTWRSWNKHGPFIWMQFAILAILSIAQGNHFGILLSLASALILQTAQYFRRPYDKLYAAATIILVMFLHPPAVAWGTPLSMLAWHELIALGAVLFIVTVLSGQVKRWMVWHDSQLEQVKRLNEATQQLIKANMSFQRYADVIEEKSAEEERKRITREIHDTVAYTLVNIMMMLREAALIAADNGKLQELHEQLIDQAQTGLNETRRALRILRAAERVKISARQQIHRLVTAFSKATGVLVNVEYGNIEDSLGEEVFRCIFHMIQEGMANAFRHGRARMIQIDLWQHDSQLLFNLRDNGTGCSNSTIEEGIGLSGMRERVQSIGGQFAVSNSYVGFQISARLPLPSEDRKQNE